VMEHGTGRPARAVLPANLIVAGKSGTSSDLRDSWFAGFSGNELVVVWVGYDDDHPTGLTGSTGALPVWADLMAHLGTTSWSATMPATLHDVAIDFPTGYAATPGCASEVLEVPVPLGVEAPPKPGCAPAPAIAQQTTPPPPALARSAPPAPAQPVRNAGGGFGGILRRFFSHAGQPLQDGSH
jgi:membrane peptidoglycan carboxypeptidase